MSVVVNAATDCSLKPGKIQTTSISEKQKTVVRSKATSIDANRSNKNTRELVDEVMDCFPAVAAAVWPCGGPIAGPVFAVSRASSLVLEQSVLVEWMSALAANPAICQKSDLPFTMTGPGIRDAGTRRLTKTYSVCQPVKRNTELAAVVVMVVLEEPRQISSIQRAFLNMVTRSYLAEMDNTTLLGQLAEANLKLNQLQAHKDWFVGAAAHYLRTPLTSIKGFAQLMTRDPNNVCGSGSPTPGTILSETDRLVDTVDDLIGLENMEKRIMSLERADVDIGDLLRDVVGSAGNLPALSNRVVPSIPKEPMPSVVDEPETKQAIIDMVCSLALSTGNISKVHLSAKPSQGGVRVCIRTKTSHSVRDDWERMLGHSFSMDGEINHSRHAIARDVYIARNIIEAQGGQILLQWKKPNNMDLLLQLPASTQPRGKR